MGRMLKIWSNLLNPRAFYIIHYVTEYTLLQVANALVSSVPRRVDRVAVVVVNVWVVDSIVVTISDKVEIREVQDEGQVSRL